MKNEEAQELLEHYATCVEPRLSEALLMASDLFEREKPKKPEKVRMIGIVLCPTCGCMVELHKKRCLNCAQVIDWKA